MTSTRSLTSTTWSRLAKRQRLPEVMDQPGIDPREHAAALIGLRRINALSGCVASLFGPIRALARSQPESPLRVLDVASGGGDTAIALARTARREGLNLIVSGCDISPQAVEIARASARAQASDVRFFVADALGDALPSDVDVITCSLFLHHLEPADAEKLLRSMAASARRLVLVNDLIRSRLGYGLAWVGCRLLSRSWIVHVDGPISVAGSFSLPEVAELAARAGLEGAVVNRCWPERYLLSWSRGDSHEQLA